MNKKFESLITERSDAIDNAVYELILLMANQTEDELDWDIEQIGEVADAVEETMKSLGILSCRPYVACDDRTPCYKMDECKCERCPMREE